MEKEINIYCYLNYRVFLSDLFQYLKKEYDFSLRKFALKADFGSHSYLKQIIDGERDISDKSVIKISKGFNLSETETKYLQIMVKFTQEKNLKEKNFYYKQLSKFRPRDPLYELEDKQYRLFSDWYHIAIRELTAAKDFTENIEQISKNLEPEVSVDEVNKSVELLLQVGLLKRNSNGKLEQVDANITTGDEVNNLSVINYHNNMLDLAKRAIIEADKDWRDISSLSLLVNREEFQTIKKRISEFRKSILQYLADRKKGHFPEDITGVDEILYHLNIQLFNGSKVLWKKPKKVF